MLESNRRLRVASVAHAVFAATMITLGILGLLGGNFAPIWIAAPDTIAASDGLAGRAVLTAASALLSLICGVLLLWRPVAAAAARILFLYLSVWMLILNGSEIVREPLMEGAYQNCGVTAVVVAGAWVLYASFAPAWDRVHLGFLVGEQGVRHARVLYGLAMLAFGLSHFVYLGLTTPFVPAYLGSPVFWAYSTGGAYLAAGVAILAGFFARLAAVLSALQIGLFLLLVWVPILAAGNVSAEHRGETLLNLAMTAGAWVIADSYRRMRWLDVRSSLAPQSRSS